ncbi:MAG: hypothetical protein H0W71_09375 [Sphingomonas sp.]|nr:hypothetical protein [Sphingomonas sp.]
MTDKATSLVEHLERQCNRHALGKCMTRKCLLRGGYSGTGPVGDVVATCEEHEAAAMIEQQAATIETLASALKMVAKRCGPRSADGEVARAALKLTDGEDHG